MSKKVIIIPDSFKGSMSSEEVGLGIENALRLTHGDWETIRLPIADGGEGSTDCILSVLGGERKKVSVLSPEKLPISAVYGITPERTAVIEIAASSGLTVQSSFNAAEATTYGFGQLILDALNEGIRSFLLCLGGSATTDCACGMAAALGVRFLDENGQAFIPAGGTLGNIFSVDISGMDERISRSTFTVMSDVKNPLFGEKGAAFVYAPQKGASPETVRLLDRGLCHAAEVFERAGLPSCSGIEGAGAAGGAGYGCVAFLGAKTVSGITAMLDICNFDAHVKEADLVITGEGRLDEQSFMGKVVQGVKSRSLGKPIIVFCGSSLLSEERCAELGVTAVEIRRGLPVEESMAHGKELLEKNAKDFFSSFET